MEADQERATANCTQRRVERWAIPHRLYGSLILDRRALWSVREARIELWKSASTFDTIEAIPMRDRSGVNEVTGVVLVE
jgi:hypothetical protein